MTGVTLLVVAKAPVPGRAKTRLTPVLTPEQAADVAAAALLDTLDAVAATPAARRVVALTGDLTAARRSAELMCSLRRFTVVAQRADGLARRLVAAHADAGPGAVLQIGMDTPQVTAELLTACAAQLLAPGTDAVLGPAHDGGWWALGVRRAELARVLADVPMSAADTGARTLRALRDAGATVAALDALSDVDVVADAVEVASIATGTRFAAAVAATGLAGAGQVAVSGRSDVGVQR